MALEAAKSHDFGERTREPSSVVCKIAVCVMAAGRTLPVCQGSSSIRMAIIRGELTYKGPCHTTDVSGGGTATGVVRARGAA